MTSGENNASLKGLVLAGGKSRRMGWDKGAIQWHGIPQKYYIANLLQAFCSQVFISCREDQLEEESHSGFISLPDRYIGMGPLGGILTAFNESDENTSWLVVACDLPLLDSATLKFLVYNRDPQLLATTYKSPFDGLPEPLITIWSPSAYPLLLQAKEKGMTCPRKVLISADIKLLDAPDPRKLMNVNTPEDAELAKTILLEQD